MIAIGRARWATAFEVSIPDHHLDHTPLVRGGAALTDRQGFSRTLGFVDELRPALAAPPQKLGVSDRAPGQAVRISAHPGQALSRDQSHLKWNRSRAGGAAAVPRYLWTMTWIN
jgi:hypothetical protein